MNPAPQLAAGRVVTRWSVVGLVLLVPTVVVASIAVLTSRRAGLCLTYGEHCSTVSGEALYGCFWGALAAGLLALVWPRVRWTGARVGVVLLQWGAQITLGALILSAR